MSRISTLGFSLVFALSASVGCGDDGTGPGGEIDAAPTPDGPAMPDGAPGMDGPAPDGLTPDAPPQFNGHLLISEVTLTNANAEFIEIYNPGTQAVALGNYYLSDDHEYWLLPAVFSQLDPVTQPRPAINPDFDFIVKFPDNATIAPGEAQVMALDYTLFEGQYGFSPHYAIYQAPGEDSAMVDPSGASGVILVGITPNLTNQGESIILFTWDGASDLVADVDMVNAGTGLTGPNSIQSKNGELVDGPDADDVQSGFAPESAAAMELDGSAAAGFSHKRIALEEGHEIQNGDSNGITGDDELSEDFSQTWDLAANYDAPTPGQVPASLMP